MSGLSDRDKAILDFEQTWWRQPGAPPTRKRVVTDALEAAGEESQADEGGD